MARKLALITGGARGIGEATAIALAPLDYHVVVTDILVTEGEQVAHKLVKAGHGAEFHRLDVKDTEGVNALVQRVERERQAPFDLLVNNAGYVKPKPLDDMKDEDWDDVLDGNLKSMMRVCRAATPAMKKARRGSIVCMSSIAGYEIGWEDRLAYCSSKAGIAGLVRSLAVDLGRWNIRVNGIAPAGMHAKPEQVPLGRTGTVADVANVVVLLASDLAGYITGQIISVDGGMSVAL